MALAVVPARGGSKRIPGKNLRDFCGRPMIAWSLAAAQEAGCFQRIVVSTDDEAIAETARGLGAEIPFARPAALADDHTPTAAVIAHAVEALGATGPVCCLYATAPFATGKDLRAGLGRLREGAARYVFPVTTFPYPIQRALRMRPDGAVEMFDAAMFARRSQDLEEAWHDAGQFYWADAATWRTEPVVYAPGAVGLPVPRHRVQDIDTEEDWARAELLFRALGRAP